MPVAPGWAPLKVMVTYNLHTDSCISVFTSQSELVIWLRIPLACDRAELGPRVQSVDWSPRLPVSVPALARGLRDQSPDVSWPVPAPPAPGPRPLLLMLMLLVLLLMTSPWALNSALQLFWRPQLKQHQWSLYTVTVSLNSCLKINSMIFRVITRCHRHFV